MAQLLKLLESLGKEYLIPQKKKVSIYSGIYRTACSNLTIIFSYPSGLYIIMHGCQKDLE